MCSHGGIADVVGLIVFLLREQEFKSSRPDCRKMKPHRRFPTVGFLACYRVARRSEIAARKCAPTTHSNYDKAVIVGSRDRHGAK